MTKPYSSYSRVELNEIKKPLEDSWAFETRAILKGQAPDPATGSTIFPLYQTSTYTQRGIDDNKGYVYSRSGNPTRTAAAEVLASLESGKHGFLYPSGIAAIHAIMQQLKPGDHVISSSDLYGGAHRLFDQIFSPLGIEFSYVDARDINNILNAIKPNTRLVWLESPTNPLMRLCDIQAITTAIAKYNKDHGLSGLPLPAYPNTKRHNNKSAQSLSEKRPDARHASPSKRSLLDVNEHCEGEHNDADGTLRIGSTRILVGFDNTFASPYLQRPLELGVDIVMHSCTKYLGGHSDLLTGGIVVADDDLGEVFKYHQNATGSIAGPFDCWMLMKGIKTLAVRMRQHHENCVVVAKWLEKHPKVRAVHCPVLESNPQHDLYKRQMTMYNGMIAFEYDGDFDTVKKVVMKAQLFQLAESLGGVESLIGHPASMTHAAVPKPRRLELGINDNLIRLSVGIENVKDIIDDLEQMLK